ncbi:M4 family metallopeptidase [Streptomyces sp. MUM 2J]|uniref:M4 family metallopeptidase n=1 Tax=Streptomyces sp. MUM 2J TaxID=2791987 RepID=UPI001F040803|nr:M4 family metallopeptidase [Streptomyces sp. MUM 2J]MCH0565913.1 M4 family metallopeptidase [Streptomyces sp. MUM 2J]
MSSKDSAELRTARAGAGARVRRSGISGAAALIGAAALLVPGPDAVAGTAGSEPLPSPGEVVPGQRTATPSLVDGIRERAPAARDAADAATAHLAARTERYRIPAPARDLEPVATVTGDGSETVRLQQRHHGVPVLGGQYVVRMEKRGGDRVVTGTSGKYFTALDTGTAAGVGEDLAVERAVDAVRTELDGRRFDGPARGDADVPRLTGISRGLVVLPTGTGVLTRHITVRGQVPGLAEPVLREVYIDARAGYPVLQYSGLTTFGAPAVAPARAAGGVRAAGTTGERPPAAQAAGSGVRLDGRTTPLRVTRDDSGAYVLRDRSRTRNGSDNVLSTWDARGTWVSDVNGKWPDGIKEFASPTPAFGTEATGAGAVDAHWAAGRVYDYYRDHFGRESLDGRGMAVNSLVGITNFGQPYVNAFWDGQKIAYGTGDAEYRPLSASLDVVGHELTHGVISHSANLVYAGQSGAMNEAIADYFGNAIETDTYGTSMDDPDAGLMGETLCRTKAPRACSFRDLNDGRTTAASFLGVGFGTDNGGVHLNSTLFSGALWDIREDLGPARADAVVYKALTEYLTPLDGFTEGRAAVIAAARALDVRGRDLRSVRRAFDAHGIVPHWELALGIDSDLLLQRVNTTDSALGAGGGWWVASQSNEEGSEPYSVWAGRTNGKGRLKLISPNDGRYHVNPATDGTTVVWQAYGEKSVEILARPLAGGPIRTLWSGRSAGSRLAVEGDVVVFEHSARPGLRNVVHLRMSDPDSVVQLGGGMHHRTSFPSLRNGRIAYQETRRVAAAYEYSTRVLDLATGEDTVVQQAGPGTSLGPTALGGDRVHWLLDEVWGNGTTALRSARIDGSDVTDLSPEAGPEALNVMDLTASPEAVTMAARIPDSEIRNVSLAKLWQFSPARPGGELLRRRVSCNRGEQLVPAAAAGTRVVWLDATTGISSVVTRSRPTGTCA